MKKIIAYVLLACMLVGLLPITAAQAQEKIPFSVLERAASYSDPETEFTESFAKRSANSYGYPSPLMEGQEALYGKSTPLRYILFSNGDHGRYLYIYIFKCSLDALSDPNFDQDPIAYDSVQFAWDDKIHEYSCWWDTKGFSTGTYSILSFTVYNGKEIISDSAMAYEIKVVQTEKPLKDLTLSDAATDKQLNAFYLKPGETRTFVLGRKPNPTTDNHNMELDFLGGAILKEYHGLVTAEATGLGYGTATITVGSQKFTYEIHVCSNDYGHRFETTQVRSSGESTYGVVMYSCPDCGYSYTERQQLTTETFRNFIDVPENAWYHEEVKSAVTQGLFNGMSEKYFHPEVSMDRGMLVTALWRYAGKPAAENAVKFNDVWTGDWYYEAVAWASGAGIVNGIGNGEFGPEMVVTREQMATILYRYAGMVGADTSARQSLSGFGDGNEVSSYAVDAIEWAVAEGIIGGSQEGSQLMIMPRGDATRAQVCAIMVRTINNVLQAEPYEIELPDCEMKESGIWNSIRWDFYDDGTLVINATEFEEKWEKFDHLKEAVKCIKIMPGMTGSFRLGGNFPNLEKVEMADSVTGVADNAFENCPKLKEIRFSPNLTTLSYRAFADCTALEELELPDTLQYMYSCAFSGCTSLKEVRLPAGLRDVQNGYLMMVGGTFANCTSLERVYLGTAMDYVPMNMFSGCTGLKEIIFADGINMLYDESFAGCTALTELVLPRQICYLYDISFKDCENLKVVTILNPYLELCTHYETPGTNGVPAPVAPFAEGTVIRGYAGSTAQALAERFGYAFEAIDE